MEIRVSKVTNWALMAAAAEYTSNKKIKNGTGIQFSSEMYLSEHSPIRTQMFVVEMRDIPTYVSVHFVRHKIGVEHFVSSNREDLSGNKPIEITRSTPVNHMMFLNAASLIYMARKRLCGKADPITREVMQRIVDEVALVDGVLANYLVRECKYRNGLCPEVKDCHRHYKPPKGYSHE